MELMQVIHALSSDKTVGPEVQVLAKNRMMTEAVENIKREAIRSANDEMALAGRCFPAGALLEREDGQMSCIEDIKVGDLVRTRGQFEPVLLFSHWDIHSKSVSYIRVDCENEKQSWESL